MSPSVSHPPLGPRLNVRPLLLSLTFSIIVDSLSLNKRGLRTSPMFLFWEPYSDSRNMNMERYRLDRVWNVTRKHRNPTRSEMSAWCVVRTVPCPCVGGSGWQKLELAIGLEPGLE